MTLLVNLQTFPTFCVTLRNNCAIDWWPLMSFVLLGCVVQKLRQAGDSADQVLPTGFMPAPGKNMIPDGTSSSVFMIHQWHGANAWLLCSRTPNLFRLSSKKDPAASGVVVSVGGGKSQRTILRLSYWFHEHCQKPYILSPTYNSNSCLMMVARFHHGSQDITSADSWRVPVNPWTSIWRCCPTSTFVFLLAQCHFKGS